MKQEAATFFIDQLVHIAVIIALWSSLFGHDATSCQDFLKAEWNSQDVWAVVIAYLLMLKPTSVMLSLFVRKWAPSVATDRSLPNAGKWIGYLERILILTFILTGNAEGIGFLLAAKSVFRFGELSKAQDIKTTEYVLIGTLASFTVAILVGFATLLLIP